MYICVHMRTYACIHMYVYIYMSTYVKNKITWKEHYSYEQSKTHLRRVYRESQSKIMLGSISYFLHMYWSLNLSKRQNSWMCSPRARWCVFAFCVFFSVDLEPRICDPVVRFLLCVPDYVFKVVTSMLRVVKTLLISFNSLKAIWFWYRTFKSQLFLKIKYIYKYIEQFEVALLIVKIIS